MLSKEKLTWLIIGVIGGYAFSRQVDKLPLINKVPKVG